MKAQDKTQPVSLYVKLRPEHIQLLDDLCACYGDSTRDHIVAEALVDAAKSKEFREWKAQPRPAVTAPTVEVPKAKEAKQDKREDGKHDTKAKGMEAVA